MSAASSTDSSISRFFVWWGSELVAMIPGAGRATLHSPRLVLSVEESGYRIYECVNGKLKPSEAAGAHVMSRPEALAGLTRRARARGWYNVGVRVCLNSCFVRRVEVPAGAEAHASRLLALDLQRNSPFLPSEVRSVHFKDTTRPGNGKVPMCQLVIKRRTVDPLVADIESAGLEVVRLDCWNDDATAELPVDFLEADSAAPPRRAMTRMLNGLLGVAALGLMCFATYLVIDRYEQALAGLKAETGMLLAKAQAAREALARSQAQYTAFANLQRVRAEYVSKPKILDELTRLIPDAAWVNDMRIEGNNTDFTGLATSAASLVMTLERSATFTDATLTAPLTFDQREDKERFSLRVRIRSASGVASAQAGEVKE